MEKYEEGCEGCLPALIDLSTGKVLPPDDPIMKAVMSVWNSLATPDKEAWHAFTCQNSREPQIMAAVARINEQFRVALFDLKK